ncbi:hypothetical protein IT575_15465 [bacterium]|nr:hypothetical protein [bacterium]
MNIVQLELQLRGVEAAQSRIRQVVEDDSLEGLEELLAEKGARMSAVLNRVVREPGLDNTVFARLGLILQADEALAGLIRRRLSVLRNEIRKTHDTGTMLRAYNGAPSAQVAYALGEL